MGELLIDSSLPGTTLQRRSGGIIGIGVMGVWGSAGYRNSGGNDFGIYSTSAVTGTAIGTGRNTNQTNANNSGIGLGVNGGVIGGYVSGEQYGFVSKGELFGAYIMGNTITNKPITQIETVNNNRVISYATTATTVDVTTRGKGKLTNGSAFVAFDAAFIQIAELNEENLNITITARGNTNGVYIEKITDKGFYVKENSNGTNSVNFNWTAVSVRKGYENGVALSKEILDANWESNMNKVMHNENSTTTQAKPIYFNGSSVLFTEIPKQPDSAYKKANSSVSEERKVATTTKELEFKLNKTKTNTKGMT